MPHQYTPAEQHTINTGNVMLSQAGMPLMTDAQEWAFIQKQRAKHGPNIGGNHKFDWGLNALALAMYGIPAYILYRVIRKA